MRATRTLPAGYQQTTSLDLARRPGLAFGLNLIGLMLFFVFFWLLLLLAGRMRGEAGLSLSGAFNLASLLALAVAYVLVLILHEALHGLFFWIFTGERPRVGIRSLYAFAGAPEWYLPRDQYLVVGLAPLVGITLLGIALLPWIPSGWLVLVVFAVSANASGAIGDAAVVAYLLLQPANILVQDHGDKFFVYGLAQPQVPSG